MLKEMNTTGMLLVGLGVVALGGLVYKLLSSRAKSSTPKPVQLSPEFVDGTLRFADVQAFYKLLKLQQGKHTPFIARGGDKLRDLLGQAMPVQEGYTPLFLGVYEESTELLIHHRLIFARDLDAEILEVLGEDDLVVLT